MLPVKSFRTDIALVGLLVCVDYLVSAQCRGLSESLSTHFADKRPGAGMHGHVAGQVVVGVEDLATLGAGVGLVLALHDRLHLGVHREPGQAGPGREVFMQTPSVNV